MNQAVFFVGWLALTLVVAAGWRTLARRERSRQRLLDSPRTGEAALGAVAEAAQSAEVAGGQSLVAGRTVQPARGLSRRWVAVPWLVGAVTAGACWLALGLSPPYLVAIGLLVALLGGQVESYFRQAFAARLEGQLADAIDIMIGAVGAGATVATAIEAAISETSAPLRPHLEELSGRIRLGDDPADVFRNLAAKVPLETFLLFASALSVHWEVGGRLAPTLTTVGRTIRDRIEISRRIQSNIVQSQLSTLAIIALTYFIAVVVWRNGPEQMQEFVGSTIGSWIVAGSIIMHAVGIVWMNMISRAKF